MTISIEITGDGVMRLTDAVRVLGDRNKAYTAFRRGLNRAGQTAFTRVKRSLAKQIGASQAATVRWGGVRRIPASGQTLETRITASGGAIPLREFGARQVRRGVSAAPWGKRRVFAGTFIVAKFGGQVMKRDGKARFPISRMWGPIVRKELVQGESAAAFRSVEPVLAAEIARQVSLMTRGVIS